MLSPFLNQVSSLLVHPRSPGAPCCLDFPPLNVPWEEGEQNDWSDWLSPFFPVACASWLCTALQESGRVTQQHCPSRVVVTADRPALFPCRQASHGSPPALGRAIGTKSQPCFSRAISEEFPEVKLNLKPFQGGGVRSKPHHLKTCSDRGSAPHTKMNNK